MAILFTEDGKEKKIVQIVDYPGLPIRCQKCGSLEHLQADCRVTTPWQQVALGIRTEVQQKILPGFASASSRRPLSQVAALHNKSIGQLLFGEAVVADIVVLKVGVLLWREGRFETKLWIPAQDRKMAFPVWDITASVEGSGEDMWAQAELKMRNMVKYDFPFKSEEEITELEGNMIKRVIAHTAQGGTVYIYFMGLIEVSKEFDMREDKRGVFGSPNGE